LRPPPRLGPGAVERGGGRLVAPELEARLPDGWAVAGPHPVPAWDALGVPFVRYELRRPLVVRPDRYVFADRALDRAASHFAARWAPPR
jgi:hypothetical protein